MLSLKLSKRTSSAKTGGIIGGLLAFLVLVSLSVVYFRYRGWPTFLRRLPLRLRHPFRRTSGGSLQRYSVTALSDWNWAEGDDWLEPEEDGAESFAFERVREVSVERDGEEGRAIIDERFREDRVSTEHAIQFGGEQSTRSALRYAATHGPSQRPADASPSTPPLLSLPPITRTFSTRFGQINVLDEIEEGSLLSKSHDNNSTPSDSRPITPLSPQTDPDPELLPVEGLESTSLQRTTSSRLWWVNSIKRSLTRARATASPTPLFPLTPASPTDTFGHPLVLPSDDTSILTNEDELDDLFQEDDESAHIHHATKVTRPYPFLHTDPHPTPPSTPSWTSQSHSIGRLVRLSDSHSPAAQETDSSNSTFWTYVAEVQRALSSSTLGSKRSKSARSTAGTLGRYKRMEDVEEGQAETSKEEERTAEASTKAEPPRDGYSPARPPLALARTTSTPSSSSNPPAGPNVRPLPKPARSSTLPALPAVRRLPTPALPSSPLKRATSASELAKIRRLPKIPT